MKTMYAYIILISLIILAGCQDREKPIETVTPLPTIEVETQTVNAQKGHLQTEVVGTVQSVKQAVIASKLTGTIQMIPVVLGSAVQKGDLLVKISAEEIAAKAVKAQAQLEQAKRNLDREKKLLNKNAATAESVRSLEEMYKIAEAARREADTMLSYTKITAPFNGVITAKMGNEGDLATPGTPLLRLEDNSKLQVEASVPETLVLLIKPGDMLNVHIPVAAVDTQGTVAEISPAADPRTRTAKVKLNIPSDAGLLSGQFARIRIPGEQIKSLFVPSSSIRTFGQMEQVFVVSDNRAHLRLIRTGVVVGDQTEILAGLEEGEIIVTSSGATITSGQPVTPQP